ncbi:hypothetical protein D917_10731 [Trichinella nativa]|uniref:Uncharacterized protein n=1 Tax=Trichinella nativa TaxID=6335 RepID=A0A1Y3E9K9_9BILA|nr:hypothetical protein D917_10731 [Trichinella nativa]
MLSELSRSLPQADRQAGRQPELAQLPRSRMFQSSKTAWLSIGIFDFFPQRISTFNWRADK